MFNNSEDKGILLEQIDKVLNGFKILNVIFAFDRPLPKDPVDIPLWARFITVLDGCKNMVFATHTGIQKISVTPGTLVFAVPYAWTSMIMDSDQTFLSIVYRDSCIRCLSALKKANDLSHELDHLYHTSDSIHGTGRHILKAMIQLATEGKDPSYAIKVSEILLLLTREQLLTDKPVKTEKSFSTYQTITEFLQENYHLDITREKLSRILNLNPSYISQLFSRYSCLSFNQQLNDIRLSRSIVLLRNTQMNINEIAYNCGYTNPSYFILLFKAQFGMTPGQFRSSYTNPLHMKSYLEQ